MSNEFPKISGAFELFLKEAPAHAAVWMGCVDHLASASVLDEKCQHLAYLAVLAALRLEGGVPFHVQLAKRAGASRAEIVSAILVGLPAAGNAVTQSLPAALAAYDAT
jgi:alkylhydroperoxidase/carboxymuconolactone decarboxylase family protein YurZ